MCVYSPTTSRRINDINIALLRSALLHIRLSILHCGLWGDKEDIVQGTHVAIGRDTMAERAAEWFQR